ARRAAPVRALRRRARRAGLHVQRAARGARGRERARRVRGRRRAADARARLAAPPGGAEPLLLEEREVAARARPPLDRPARLLGALRLPQRRELLERRALRLLDRASNIRPSSNEGER